MRKLLIALAALLVSGAFFITEADAAKRLGGARSSGAQRNVTSAPPASTPAKPAQQQGTQQAAGQSQAAPAAGAAGAAAAPASGFAKWAPLLGGLAIGGLLGSLFAGNGLGGLLLIALLAIAAVVVFKMLARRRAEGAPQTMQYAGTNERVTLPPQSPAAPVAMSGMAGSTAPAGVPAGFDVPAFLRGAKLNFMKLQVANNAGKLDELRELTTPEMYEVLAQDVRERGGAQDTDIASVNAELLEVAIEDGKYWASVRFSGLEREAPGAAAVEFSEVWNLAKPVDGSSGWLLAGIQQTQ